MAQRPIVWETAWRIGAAIRSQVNCSFRENENGKERVRPHVRRAHWHTLLTGPLNGPRDARVKWLPPTVVNVAAAGGLEALIPVVRNPRGSPNCTARVFSGKIVGALARLHSVYDDRLPDFNHVRVKATLLPAT